MTWIDELREDLVRQQAETNAQTEADADGDIVTAARLVRGLLEQMNQELLASRGSVWETNVRWGLQLWELWWGRTRIEGPHIVVTLLRDSRGTPYLKVQRTRLALHDPLVERRLQRALQAAFLQPSVYTPRAREPRGMQLEPSWGAQ